MAYLVLARKYRPQFFRDVVGQDHVTKTLLNALQQDRIAHGYIFSGHRGIGKTTIARILAMALNCRNAVGSAERPTPEPCGICESCTEIRAGNSVDVVEIDAATNRGIDEIRDLREAARYRPARDRFRIYILDEAHQITDAAFNALLKTLEEPPDHVVFMMATTQPEDIPQTIRSRCQHYSFHAVAFDDIVAQLTKIAGEENIIAGEEVIGLLAEAGDGSMRDALSIMDQAIASAPQNESGLPVLEAAQVRDLMGTVSFAVFEQILEEVSSGSSAAVLRQANRMLNAGQSAQQLARQMVKYLRNVLMARLAGENSELLQISPDERARAARTALLFSEEDLTRFLQIMLRTFDDLGYRQEHRLHFELGLLKLVHAQRLLPLEEILSGADASRPSSQPPSRGPAAGQQTERSVAAASPVPAPLPRQDAPPPRPVPAPRATPSPQEAPGFSPFEQDVRRRGPVASAPAKPGAPLVRSISRESTPSPRPAQTATTEGALALAEAPHSSPVPVLVSRPTPAEVLPETLPDAIPEPAPAEPNLSDRERAVEALPPGTASPDLDRIRGAIVAALNDAGQSSAAEALDTSIWTPSDTEWCIAVPCSTKMLGICMNADARRIADSAARASGVSPAKLTYQAAGSDAPRAGSGARTRMRTASGPLAEEAMNHPLVKRARELFNAEVRQVIEHKSER